MSTAMLDPDVVIIGAGTAGLSALAEVKKTTERVVLIESGPLGTMCARTGCMPSKALIAGTMGAALPSNSVDLLAHVRELRDSFVDSAARSTETSAPHLLRGRARLNGPGEVHVGDVILRPKSIIIATGSTPIVPPAWRDLGARVMTTDTFFEQRDLPKSCAVIGTGPIGLELGQAMARAGVRVTVFGLEANVGNANDPAVREAALALIGRDVALHVGPKATPGAGDLVVSGGFSVAAERVLLSVGRRANVDGLGLETLGVPLDDRGVPHFDPVTRRVAELPVFIAGDVAGDRPIQHEAAYQGRVAAVFATTGGPSPFAAYPRLLITFTHPQMAAIGLTFDDAVARGAVIGEVDFARQGRARVMNEAAGVLRLYADVKDGRLLGAEMICPAAEHLAHLLAFALTRESTVGDLLKMPFYHPTLEEGLRTALVHAQKQISLNSRG